MTEYFEKVYFDDETKQYSTLLTPTFVLGNSDLMKELMEDPKYESLRVELGDEETERMLEFMYHLSQTQQKLLELLPGYEMAILMDYKLLYIIMNVENSTLSFLATVDNENRQITLEMG